MTSISFVKLSTRLRRTLHIWSMFVFEALNRHLASWSGHLSPCHWTITTPAFAAGEHVQNRPIGSNISSFLLRGHVDVHSQVVCVVRHLDRLPHNGLFMTVDYSCLVCHHCHGGSSARSRGRCSVDLHAHKCMWSQKEQIFPAYLTMQIL